jgi:uncharacterized protein
MTNFIPIFPLGLVVYPGEQLNLHIFEPRYKQLINECFADNKPFGIPAVINNQIATIGTLVQVAEITTVYDDGKMDIKTLGLRVFDIIELIKEIPDKLYSGAIVTYPANDTASNARLLQTVLNGIRELHGALQVSKEFKKADADLCSYDIAHHAGLSLQEENELLALQTELQRLEYLKRHLQKVLPVINEMESLKHRIQLNGHFKNIKGFEW